MISIANSADIVNDDGQPQDHPSPTLSSNKKRLQVLGIRRDATRERLRAYERAWRIRNPDRVKVHRENEYAERKKKRHRKKQRREAQRRRRAAKRLETKKRWS